MMKQPFLLAARPVSNCGVGDHRWEATLWVMR